MSDTEARAAERGDDEAAALLAYRRTHDTRACPVCGWAGSSLLRRMDYRIFPMHEPPTDGLTFFAHEGPQRPIRACGRCGVAYVEDAAGLSLECMEFEAARRGEAT